MLATDEQIQGGTKDNRASFARFIIFAGKINGTDSRQNIYK